MRKLIGLFALLALLGTQICFAQTREITGTVLDKADNSPLPGVSVIIKGSQPPIGTSTDINGRFTLRVSETDVLVFSFMGMKNTEVAVAGKNNISVPMESASEQLDEVLVVAYGSTKKDAFTGTAAVVKADDLKDLQVSSVSQALQGLASGVMVVNTSGQPGENATIRVRGIGSYSGSADPLIVLDGIPYNGNMNTINLKEIESMTILKDANSTALYGSRAANGVILMTTKSGREGQTAFSVNASYGATNRAVKEYKFLNAREYMEMQWEALYFEGMDAGRDDAWSRNYATNNVIPRLKYNPYSVNNPVGTDGKILPEAKLLYQEDWEDVLLRTGKRQEYDLQARGGSKDVKYLISGGYLQDEGIVRTSKYERYNIRGKIDAQLKPWLKLGLNMATSYSIANFPTQGGTNTRNSISFVRQMASIYPAYMREKDGTLIRDKNGKKMIDYGDNSVWGRRPVASGTNPLGTFEHDDIRNKRFVSTNNLYLEAVWRDFSFRSTLAVEYYELYAKSYYNPAYGDGKAYKGRSQRDRQLNTTITTSNVLTYDKTMDTHHVNVTAVAETNDYKFERMTAEKRGFDFGDKELDYGGVLNTASSNRTGTRNARFLGRVNYDYDNRYHLSASLTYDGTSRFHKDERWGTFWSAGAAWNISKEEFFSDLLPVVSYLKLRASYGTSGNQNLGTVLGYFPYMATYDGQWPILGNLGSIVDKLGNEKLKWEKQNQLDLGIDYSLFENKFSGSFTYFTRKSKDLLMARPLPTSAGITTFNDNVGEVKNSGVEIEFKAQILDDNDFRWSAGFNVSYIKNEMTKLPTEVKDGFNATNYKRIEKGKSMYSWYLQKWAGVDPDDGKPMWYVDVENPDGTISRETTKSHASGTRYFVGQSTPKWTGGINTNFSWKGLEFNAMASFAAGNKILDTDKAGLMHMYDDTRTGYQASKDALKRWQKPGDRTNVPRVSTRANNFNSPSTRWLVNGRYLRMKNITLGYNLAYLEPIKRMGINNMRIYVSGDNLFTIFGTKGVDPELGLHGITSNNSSALRTISVGLNLDF